MINCLLGSDEALAVNATTSLAKPDFLPTLSVSDVNLSQLFWNSILRGHLTTLSLSCIKQYCLNYVFSEDKDVEDPVCLRSYLHVVLDLGHKANIIPWLFKMCMTDIAEKSSKLHHAVLTATAKEL